MNANDAERGKALAASGKYAPFPDLGIPIVDVAPVQSPPDAEPDNAVDGAAFILDQPEGVPAIWGRGSEVLWARGEALMIAGGQGLGKTTLAGLLLKALLGLITVVLGLPVSEMDCKILYLAMDRPSQIARSLARQFTPSHRQLLLDRVTFWKGPPPRDLAANPALLARMAEFYGAGIVIVDSLKDAAVRLSEDSVGSQWNRARQHLLAQGCQLLELHHTTKRGPQGAPVIGVADIYGSTWLTSGAGSVILLTGEPGDPIISFRHVKQPANEVGPWQLSHDQQRGLLDVESTVDLIELVKATGVDGLTAKGAAVAITEKPNPSRADIEKVRRRLDEKVVKGLLVRLDGNRGGPSGSAATSWFLAERNQTRAITLEDELAGQSNHAEFTSKSNHEPNTPVTLHVELAGQSNHAENHANHAAANHVSNTPIRGV